MLVCKMWFEVGGHPSLWAQFPLKLSGNLRNLKRYSKIRRLGWVNSLDLRMIGSMKKSLVTLVEAAIKALPCLEQLDIFCDNKFLCSKVNQLQFVASLQDILKTAKNKLARVNVHAGAQSNGSPLPI